MFVIFAPKLPPEPEPALHILHAPNSVTCSQYRHLILSPLSIVTCTCTCTCHLDSPVYSPLLSLSFHSRSSEALCRGLISAIIKKSSRLPSWHKIIIVIMFVFTIVSRSNKTLEKICINCAKPPDFEAIQRSWKWLWSWSRWKETFA